MGYCTLQDVKDSVQTFVINATTSKPNEGDVTGWIDQITSQMNRRLSAVGVVLPITGADALNYLKQVASWGVTAQVYRNTGVEIALAEHYQKLFDDNMENLTANPAITGSTPSAPGISFNEEREAEFKIGTRQW